jgi:hypothetical protein
MRTAGRCAARTRRTGASTALGTLRRCPRRGALLRLVDTLEVLAAGMVDERGDARVARVLLAIIRGR